jgi:hypothetical protein
MLVTKCDNCKEEITSNDAVVGGRQSFPPMPIRPHILFAGHVFCVTGSRAFRENWVAVFARLGRGFFVRSGSRILRSRRGRKRLRIEQETAGLLACVRATAPGSDQLLTIRLARANSDGDEPQPDTSD